ncbi:MAG: thioesterase II family protein, partial [Frankia sp.]
MTTGTFRRGNRSSALVRFADPSGALRRLVCLPWAGVGAAPYHAWQRVLPDGTDMLCARPPGRETRIAEPPATDIVVAAAEIVEELGGLTDLPTVLFGRCMGAVLAIEVLRGLAATGDPLPIQLAVIDSDAPSEFTAGRAPTEIAADLAQVRAAITDDWVYQLAEQTLKDDVRMLDRYTFSPDGLGDVPVLYLTSDDSPPTESTRARVAAWRTLFTDVRT